MTTFHLGEVWIFRFGQRRLLLLLQEASWCNILLSEWLRETFDLTLDNKEMVLSNNNQLGLKSIGIVPWTGCRKLFFFFLMGGGVALSRELWTLGISTCDTHITVSSGRKGREDFSHMAEGYCNNFDHWVVKQRDGGLERDSWWACISHRSTPSSRGY